MAQTTRQAALGKLAKRMPAMSEQAAKRDQATQAMQLQQAAAAQPTGPGAGVTAAQQLGAASAATAGQAQAARAQTEMGRLDTTAQLGMQERGRQAREEQFSREMQQRQERANSANRLNQLSRDAKREILDSRLQFNQDQAGQKYMNERQLADWMITKAKSKEEFANYAQTAQQEHQKKMQIMNTANQKLDQILKQGYLQKKGDLDQQSILAIQKAKADLEKKMRKDAADAANKQAMWQTGGTIVGTAIGAFGGPAGAAVGGSVGGAAGSLLGSKF